MRVGGRRGRLKNQTVCFVFLHCQELAEHYNDGKIELKYRMYR